jgi:hypothetical protein
MLDDHEREFFAWAGKPLLGLLAGAATFAWAWLGKVLWDRSEKLPKDLAALNERCNGFATRDSLMRLKDELRDEVRELGKDMSQQRREMHSENTEKLDTILEEGRTREDMYMNEIRELHRRMNEHIEKHHTR